MQMILHIDVMRELQCIIIIRERVSERHIDSKAVVATVRRAQPKKAFYRKEKEKLFFVSRRLI